MSLEQESIEALAAAEIAARAAYDDFDERRIRAAEAKDFDASERFAAARDSAQRAENQAGKRLRRQLLNPKGEDVVSLRDATAKLEKRIVQFKKSAATLSQVAAAIGALTQIIMLFSVV